MSIVNCDETTTHIAGISFNNDDGSSRRDLARSLVIERAVHLIREPENKYDKNAVKIIFTRNGLSQQIGYLPKNYALVVAKCLDSGKFKVKFARLSGSLKRNAIIFALKQVTEEKRIKVTKISCDAVKQVHVRTRDSDVCIYCGVTYMGVRKPGGGWRFVGDSDLESEEAAKRETWMQESDDVGGLLECVVNGHSVNSNRGYCTWCGKGGGAVLRDGEYLSEEEQSIADNHERVVKYIPPKDRTLDVAPQESCEHTAVVDFICQQCGKIVAWSLTDHKLVEFRLKPVKLMSASPTDKWTPLDVVNRGIDV